MTRLGDLPPFGWRFEGNWMFAQNCPHTISEAKTSLFLVISALRIFKNLATFYSHQLVTLFNGVSHSWPFRNILIPFPVMKVFRLLTYLYSCSMFSSTLLLFQRDQQGSSILWNYFCRNWTSVKLWQDFDAVCEMPSEFSSGHICACYLGLAHLSWWCKFTNATKLSV